MLATKAAFCFAGIHQHFFKCGLYGVFLISGGDLQSMIRRYDNRDTEKYYGMMLTTIEITYPHCHSPTISRNGKKRNGKQNYRRATSFKNITQERCDTMENLGRDTWKSRRKKRTG
jgi:hypothetical protein